MNNFGIIIGATWYCLYFSPSQTIYTMDLISHPLSAQLTQELNEKLGTVIDSSPTEEMFEQEVVLTNQQSVNIGVEGSGNDYGAAW